MKRYKILYNHISVFKLQRPKAQWPNPQTPVYYDMYYIRIIDGTGKQMLRNSNTTIKADAEKLEMLMKRKVRAEGYQAMVDAL